MEQEEIDELQDHQLDIEHQGKIVSKIVRIFLGGDYEFLCENYGHRGANSTEFCLWCKILLDQKKAEGPWVPRTRKELEEFTGKKPIFCFELDRVVVLPLHITLGVLSMCCDELDKQVFYLLI